MLSWSDLVARARRAKFFVVPNEKPQSELESRIETFFKVKQGYLTSGTIDHFGVKFLIDEIERLRAESIKT